MRVTSSSLRVRQNQPIEKWYRIDAKTGLYRWSDFNERYSTDRFSENSFARFVQGILTENPDALAVESENPWQQLSTDSISP
jgi:hypothetical protein